ncbi:hypothetical protein BOO29_02775 [Vibrio navarrensis]|uniref:hypothetical protein n=1 Tax=Vibrio navarrensis TaxID=29495 RepID=UPI001558873C|nr:hypothetical protein [Vibrio navarrensis]MBE3664487.1 hypothetical protein [Vibrio navarrensis]MBE4580621.1 hypothetical protein [Vibrio navarrensis]MBE4583911.1 hypothetical protein [Vibrio navarrensis]MBE4587636.1 hypothetical protein [Vibrio navarrensis]MBE4599884.1 hypothetical protein [Vibrio navarrensis]
MRADRISAVEPAAWSLNLDKSPKLCNGYLLAIGLLNRDDLPVMAGVLSLKKSSNNNANRKPKQVENQRSVVR